MQSDCGPSLAFFLADPRVAKGRHITNSNYPDDDSTTPGQKLDCIVEWTDGSKLATEHTRLEGLANHLRVESVLDDFALAVQAITIPNRLVDIELPETFAAGPKHSLRAVIDQITSTLKSVLPTLGDGEAVVSISGQGDLRVEIEVSDTPSTRLYCWSGDGEASESYFQTSVKKALRHKNVELGQHKALGFCAVLLLETLDRTRTRPSKIKSAVLCAVEPVQRNNVDEIWSLRGGPRGGYSLDQVI